MCNCINFELSLQFCFFLVAGEMCWSWMSRVDFDGFYLTGKYITIDGVLLENTTLINTLMNNECWMFFKFNRLENCVHPISLPLSIEDLGRCINDKIHPCFWEAVSRDDVKWFVSTVYMLYILHWAQYGKLSCWWMCIVPLATSLTTIKLWCAK